MYYFIVNQNSGRGRASKIWREIEVFLNSKKVDYYVSITKSKSEVEKCLHEIKASEQVIDAVIAVGGDGTIHEVMNQLIGSSIPFSVIPTGSGNDFARARGIDHNYLKQIKRIINGKQIKIDLMHTERKHCMTVIGLGFDGMVAKVTNETKAKKWLGSFSYIISVLKVLRTYKPSNIVLIVDHVRYEYRDVWLVAVANHPFYGGGMKICPDASSEDGKLDICVIYGQNRWQLLSMLPSVFKGKHVKYNGIDIIRGEVITVESDEQLLIHGDGEMIGETPVTVSIKKNAFNVLG